MAPVQDLNKPNIGQRIPKKNLPFLQDGSLLQPAQQQFTQADTQQGNTNVLGTAQRFATQKANQPKPVQGLVEKQTQGLLNNQTPLITDKSVQAQLDKATRLRGEAFGQFRQGSADTAGTAGTRNATFNLALKGAQDQTDLEQRLKTEQAVTNRTDMFNKLKMGQDVARTSSGLDTEAFNRLVTARGAGEGERAQIKAGELSKEQSQLEIASGEKLALAKIASTENLANMDNESKLAITELQGKINQGLQVTDQDYKLAENALDRALKLALQSGDKETAIQLQNMKGEISKLGIASGEKIAIANITAKENLALLDVNAKESLVKLQGKIQEGLLISDAELKATEAELDRELKLALQKGDTDAAIKLQDMKDAVNKLGLASSEKVAFAKIASTENLAMFDRETQIGLTELKNKLDTGVLMKQQDFAAEMDAIEKAHALAVQNKDQAGAEKLQTMKGDLQQVILTKQQEFAHAEHVGKQAWMSSEAVLDKDFASAQKYLEQKHDIAVQSNNITAQTQIAKDKALLDLKMQTNSMTHAEKMTNLEATLAQAKADGDLERQKLIMTFAQTQEFDKMEKEQGYTEALKNLDSQLKISLQSKDFENTKVLQEIKHTQEMKIHIDKMQLEKAKTDLAEAGIDMAKIEKQYNFLLNEVAAGRLEPGVATEFLQSTLKDDLPPDFKFTPPDENAVQNALVADYKTQQFQYALTFGDQDGDGKLDAGEYDDKGNFTGLNSDSLESFSDHMAETVYDVEGGSQLSNDKIDIMASGKGFDKFGGDKTSELYKAFLADTTIPEMSTRPADWAFIERYKGDGKAASIFSTMEHNEFIKIGGKLFHVDSITRDQKAGDDDTLYTLKDPLTGKTHTILASDRDGSTANRSVEFMYDFLGLAGF